MHIDDDESHAGLQRRNEVTHKLPLGLRHVWSVTTSVDLHYKSYLQYRFHGTELITPSTS